MLRALSATLLLAAFPSMASNDRTYALVAAFEDRFTFIYETPAAQRSASPRVDRFRRERIATPAGTFNRVALGALESLYAREEPDSRRTLLALRVEPPGTVGREEREAALLANVREQLARMPGRREWDRVVVAMPSLRRLEMEGVPGRLEGFGVFLQPNCQGGPRYCGMGFAPPSGAMVRTPDGRNIKANFYVSPFSHVAVLTLDAATFEVIERQEAYANEKFHDPGAAMLDRGRVLEKDFLARQVVDGIGRALSEAVTGTRRTPEVDVKDVREVAPKPGA